MRGDGAITGLLNEVLTAELTSVNQYFVDSKMLGNWGYELLAKHYYDESIDEMKDADELIGRILFLEGVPNLQRLGTVRVGETVPEKLQLALDLEYESIDRLNLGTAAKALGHAAEATDHLAGALELARSLIKDFPKEASYQSTLSRILTQLPRASTNTTPDADSAPVMILIDPAA